LSLAANLFQAENFMYPVFMYHKVGAGVVERGDTFLNVSAHDFRRQMRQLAQRGYSVRPFSEIVDALRSGKSLPKRTCAITFDDGYQCVGQHAAPIMAEFGFAGTVFVVSQAIGKTNDWDSVTGHPVLPLMNEAELRKLHADGWELAGHTRTHPHLNLVSDADALEEIRGGREELEHQFGVPLHTFCYPFGDYNDRTPHLVLRAGYRGACTTVSGLARSASDPCLVSRVKVAYRDGVFGFFYRLLVCARFLGKSPQRNSAAIELT
jgi:peptidoglycan/xylan/chitin deacetylase (PgdA/CDA1 family)